MQVVIGAVLTFLIMSTVTLPSYPEIQVSDFLIPDPVAMVMFCDCSYFETSYSRVTFRHRCTAQNGFVLVDERLI